MRVEMMLNEVIGGVTDERKKPLEEGMDYDADLL